MTIVGSLGAHRLGRGVDVAAIDGDIVGPGRAS
jgi:hypothetical protein